MRLRQLRIQHCCCEHQPRHCAFIHSVQQLSLSSSAGNDAWQAPPNKDARTRFRLERGRGK